MKRFEVLPQWSLAERTANLVKHQRRASLVQRERPRTFAIAETISRIVQQNYQCLWIIILDWLDLGLVGIRWTSVAIKLSHNPVGNFLLVSLTVIASKREHRMNDLLRRKVCERKFGLGGLQHRGKAADGRFREVRRQAGAPAPRVHVTPATKLPVHRRR